jgi:hypothetical protein
VFVVFLFKKFTAGDGVGFEEKGHGKNGFKTLDEKITAITHVRPL